MSPERDRDQLAQKPVVRPAEAEVDDVGAILDGEIECLRETQRVAQRRRRTLPAGTEAKEARAGRNPGNANAVTRLGRDDPRDGRPVLLTDILLPGYEVTVQQQLPCKVRVRGIDAAVDHRDARSAPGSNLMEVGEVPLDRRGLSGE